MNSSKKNNSVRRRVLFLGEGDLSGPARYLASVLKWAGISFDHRPDQAPVPKVWQTPARYDAILLSDYRYNSFTAQSRTWLTDEVARRGTGFLMIGGWASFTGLVGGYSGTPIETLLPVYCVPKDDRVNWASGSLVQNAELGMSNSAYRASNSAYPMVCGYHRAMAKPGTKITMTLRDLHVRGTRVTLGRPHPLLVRGCVGNAQTAAFLTDCAPHWAGGLVDWGRKRVTVKVAPGISTELGDRYLTFFSDLIHSLFRK